jgi:glyoxylase I family protein
VSLIVSDLEKAKWFYAGILGLEQDLRPDLGFEGLFFKLGEHQQLHLLCVENPYKHCVRPTHGGRDRHIAFSVNHLEAIRKRLDAEGVDYTLSQSGRAALFCYDQDGNAIELCEVKEPLN